MAGDTVAGVGIAIASTGEGIADSVNGVARSLANYVKEQGNYVKDYTKAPGPRAPTASNPLGLEGVGGNTAVNIPYPILGMGSVVKKKKEIEAAATRKAIAAAPAPAPKSSSKTATGAIAKPSAQVPVPAPAPASLKVKAAAAATLPTPKAASASKSPPTPVKSAAPPKPSPNPGALPKSNSVPVAAKPTPPGGPFNKSKLSQPVKTVTKPANNTSPSASQTNQILAARVKAEIANKKDEAKKGRGAAKTSSVENKTPEGVKK